MQTRAAQSVITETLTLEPLRTEGPDALSPDSDTGILKITLRELELTWNNSRSAVLVRKADDVFACAAEHGAHENPIPTGAQITQAKLAFQFYDSPNQYILCLRPPATLGLPPGNHVDQIKMWLSKSPFVATAKNIACNILLILALAAFALSAPETGDPDDDPDTDLASDTRNN